MVLVDARVRIALGDDAAKAAFLRAVWTAEFVRDLRPTHAEAVQLAIDILSLYGHLSTAE